MKDVNFKLHMNGENFLQYIHESPIGYLLIDGNGLIKAINPILLHATYYSEEELLNQPFSKLLYFEGTAEEFIKKLSKFRSENSLRLSWKDVNGKPCYSKVLVWENKQGTKMYAIAFLDIHKERYPSLVSRFAENFVSDINIGLIVIDQSFHIVEISSLACKLLNVSKNEVVNKSIDEVFFDVPDEHRIVQRTLLNGITVKNQAIAWSSNQQKFDLLVDSNIIRDETGHIVGAYVIFKDVTNLRSLEQQVRQSDRLATIGQIAAGTAHEIRNPLTSIKGFLQILKTVLAKNQLNNEIEYTDIMLSEIERINKLVNEILLLSKPKDVIYQALDINTVLKQLYPIIQNEGLLHGVEVNYDLTESLPLVIADSELLKQVFLNVSKNGIEAMSEGGILNISTKIDEENKRVEIAIHDNGPGIPNYIADKIFEPFFTTKSTGTGLGLSICQKIIHDLGGSIRVSTKGFGTTFQISLPFH
ncbi:MAG: ATP-binding protein [Tepidibacillus sp.]